MTSTNGRSQTFKFGALGLGDFVHDTNPNFFNGAYVFGGGDAVPLTAAGTAGAGSVPITALEQYRRALLQLPGGTPTTFEQGSGSAIVPLAQWQQAFYVLDHFRLNRRMTVDAGMRYQLQNAPDLYRGIAPRLGVGIDLDGKGQWMLHVRGGFFPQALDVQYAREVDRLNGLRQQQTTIYSPLFGAPYTGGNGSIAVSTFDRFSENIHLPAYFENEFTLEHTFPRKWQALVLYDRGQEYGIIRQRNINAPEVGDSISAADPLAALPAMRPVEPGVNINSMETEGHEFGQLLLLSLAQRSAKRFSVTGRYLFATGHGEDEDETALISPQNSYSKQGEVSRPAWQSKNRVQVIDSLQLPLRFELASQFDAAGGAPYDIVTGTDDNGDGIFNERPSFAAAPGQGVYSTRYGLLTSNATNGNVPRNAGTMPALMRTSLDLTRTISLERNRPDGIRSISLNARGSNMLNHVNVTAVDPVVGSSSFDSGVSAQPGRRVEFGARLNF